MGEARHFKFVCRSILISNSTCMIDYIWRRCAQGDVTSKFQEIPSSDSETVQDKDRDILVQYQSQWPSVTFKVIYPLPRISSMAVSTIYNTCDIGMQLAVTRHELSYDYCTEMLPHVKCCPWVIAFCRLRALPQSAVPVSWNAASPKCLSLVTQMSVTHIVCWPNHCTHVLCTYCKHMK